MSDAKQEPRAKLDYSRVGGKWRRDYDRTLNRVARLIMVLQRPLPTDPDAANALMDRKEAVFDELETLQEAQYALVAQVVKEIPPEWVVDGAPEDINWNDPEQLMEWLQADRYQMLLEEVNSRAAVTMVQEDAKN